MIKSCRRQLRVSLISAGILRCTYYYASIVGVVSFRLKRSQLEDRFVARNRCWYKWFCVLIRIAMCYIYFGNQRLLMNWSLTHVEILKCFRGLGNFTFAIVIIVSQILYGQEVLQVTNSYLRIFRRVKALSAAREMGFGGKRELTLLLLKMVSLFCEIYSTVLAFLSILDVHSILPVTGEVYTGISSALVSHICCLGYLSVGALYDRTNRYVRNELRQELQDLQNCRGGQPSRRRLRAAEERLDEVLEIYDEIQRVAMKFHKLFELVLGFILLCGFMNMALVSYYVLLKVILSSRFWLIGGKILLDLVVLIMAIHGSCSSSRVVRRLSLENYYVSERSDWHTKLEMFLNRLNFYEFRIRPLGLIDVSNELILVFLSAMVTYLTFVLQYSMHSQRS